MRRCAACSSRNGGETPGIPLPFAVSTRRDDAHSFGRRNCLLVGVIYPLVGVPREDIGIKCLLVGVNCLLVGINCVLASVKCLLVGEQRLLLREKRRGVSVTGRGVATQRILVGSRSVRLKWGPAGVPAEDRAVRRAGGGRGLKIKPAG